MINDNEVPEGGWPGAGRPAKNLNYGTDKSPFGRDPIGMKDVGNTLKVSNSPKVNHKGNSPLSLENRDIGKLIDSMSGIKIKTKKIISESLKPSVIEENE
ncbi:MAG: hypothetical protein ACKPKO_50090, partial [Candidatus Fonsibacter sp.]